ncbi:putative cysteinyl-tRNA synthetase [Tilletiaria anomala UBC 951]|uniref:cysteine--tRNA ligase n=1 Tax=Tilletiaria anomala (strain ATCC 24038 / CBS 436.72 / UBC 951) TaxID=1037660 RepID=A0A066VYC6_TILAU|nr:putative cysteinyl-tRNA synthetase [Tilletiaria anomala UBC 951]KDN46476.1 putative cysteinyl-tRNA synthetase [Tilletiaria anomala UBC 951]
MTSTAAASTKAMQPPWHQPRSSGPEPVLHVYNSLTRSKVPFVSMRPKQVTWYNCGPTVYDASHMGHARNYVTQDIIKRILRDYFGYDIHFVMNITDIDDKIILRARQFHLLKEYQSQHPTLSSPLLLDIREAWQIFLDKTIGKLAPPPGRLENEQLQEGSLAMAEAKFEEVSRLAKDEKWLREAAEKEPKFGMWLNALNTSRQAQLAAAMSVAAKSDESSADLITASADVLAPWLDASYGSGVTDPGIFRELAAKWETEFFKDMARLNVERPTTLTRVSEYLPEVVDFVEKIIKRGYAYADGGVGGEESKRNVWFDTKAFDGAKEPGDADGSAASGLMDGERSGFAHSYAKLAPWSKGNRELLEEGEGSLSTSAATTQGKRSPADFALWKASKPGEPAWPSPWGPGRPGWHIECSVMASAVLGPRIDIHSGGVDLMFPHHDNEIAQSEAHHGCRQWINYFLHTGHLHIEGLKMSKSLKNFISIDDALRRYSARQLRLAFLFQAWNSKMDFRESAMAEVRNAESTFNNFFSMIKAHLQAAASRGLAYSDGKNYYHEPETKLMATFIDAQDAFRRAMCDNFDTPAGVQVLLDLVSKVNVYERSTKRSDLEFSVLEAPARWVGEMLRMLGLGAGPKHERDISWGSDAAGAEASFGSQDRETILAPYLQILAGFRDEMRKLSRSEAPHAAFLALADKLRDVDLAQRGVALEDQEDGTSLVKFVPAEQLLAARAEKEKAAADKERRKRENQERERVRRLEQLEKGRYAPDAMFRDSPMYQGQFGAFDDGGMPMKDAKGEELSKGKRKALEKERKAQDKLHQAFLDARDKGEIQ